MKEYEQKVYLFGAGVNGKKIVSIIGEKNIIDIVDNSQWLIGEKVSGINVISFVDFLKKYKGEDVWITSVYFADEIRQQLWKEGIISVYKCPFIPAEMMDINKWAKKLFNKYKLFDIAKISIYPANLLTKHIADSFRNQNYGGQIDLLENKEEIIAKTDENEQEDFLMILYDTDGTHGIKVINLLHESCNELDFESLKKYKDINIGEKCFIIGNGPSLTGKDLEVLYKKGITCFGCNGIYKIFEHTNWRPTYYFWGDPDAFRSIGCILEGQKYFMSDVMKQFNFKNSNIEYFRLILKLSEEGYPLFSEDIVLGVSGGRTATFVMLQFAVYMGFKEIFLLGVDFSWGENGGKTHFCDSYADSKYEIKIRESICHKNELLKTYGSAKKYAQDHGIKIYNATRGGNLEVFERVDFDLLF